jgi:hypothetical protein
MEVWDLGGLWEGFRVSWEHNNREARGSTRLLPFSNSVKKSQPALPISKIDERLQQYTQATEVCSVPCEAHPPHLCTIPIPPTTHLPKQYSLHLISTPPFNHVHPIQSILPPPHLAHTFIPAIPSIQPISASIRIACLHKPALPQSDQSPQGPRVYLYPAMLPLFN